MSPYCLDGECGVVPILNAATAPRLEAVPHQQVLNLSNQVDGVQRGTTFFEDMPQWTTAAREAYCDTQGLTGIKYFLSADPNSIHGILTSTDRFENLTAGGVSVRDWLSDAMTNPAGVVDRVDEGTLAKDLGIQPFACSVD